MGVGVEQVSDTLRAEAQAIVAALFPELTGGATTSKAKRVRKPAPITAPIAEPETTEPPQLWPALDYPHPLTCPRCWKAETWRRVEGGEPPTLRSVGPVPVIPTPDRYVAVNIGTGDAPFWLYQEVESRAVHPCEATRYAPLVVACQSCRATAAVSMRSDVTVTHAEIHAALEGRGWTLAMEYGWSPVTRSLFGWCPAHATTYPVREGAYTDLPIIGRRRAA